MPVNDAVNLARIRLADYNLSACGVPTLPDGARFVDIPKTLIFNIVVPPANDATTHGLLPDERQGTQANTLFMLGSIQALQANNIKTRFQWPNGRYLQNAPGFINALYANGPRYRKCLRYPVQIPPGTQIRVYLQNTLNNSVQVVFAFEGWLRYYLAPGDATPCCIERL